METKIKICGLMGVADVECANRCRPDYVGFVFAESKRRVTREEAVAMRERLDERIPAVGVFVREKVERVASLYGEGVIQMVQLHGGEDAAYVEELKRRTDAPILYAIRVKDEESFREVEGMPVDYYLLDAYVKGRYGGSGVCFDLSLIPPEWEKPYLIAGGLCKDNLPHVLEACRPFAVDVSSGVETDGKKDGKKMQEMVSMVRNFPHQY